MKRTHLIRRTPLRRGTKRLARMSREKRAVQVRYDAMCFMDGKGRYADRHHPFGRHGLFLLCYIIRARELHDHWHGEGRKQAMRAGWLQPPFEGRPYDPAWPRPWAAEEEARWPEQFRRP